MTLATTRLATAVVLLFLAAPLAPTAAQPSEGLPRIGVLHPRTRSDASPQTEAFLEGLRELGWVEGRNVVIEYRWADGRPDRLPDLAADLVRLKVDVIFAGNTSVAVAAKNATGTIPIVMATGGDPVGLGLVASLARPGGNVTGLSSSVGKRAQLRDLAAKRRLPAMYGSREYTEAGGLMSYGPDYRDNFLRSATYVDKILKGAKPADLPVEQPTRFKLVINMKTAKALGLTIPQSLLLRAGQVIE